MITLKIRKGGNLMREKGIKQKSILHKAMEELKEQGISERDQKIFSCIYRLLGLDVIESFTRMEIIKKGLSLKLINEMTYENMDLNDFLDHIKKMCHTVENFSPYFLYEVKKEEKNSFFGKELGEDIIIVIGVNEGVSEFFNK